MPVLAVFHHHIVAQPLIVELCNMTLFKSESASHTFWADGAIKEWVLIYDWWIDSDVCVHTCTCKDIHKERDPYKIEVFILCL